ncbi:hypothetical protein ACFVGV_17485 [Pseudarthrobacter scleromae]|uniref:hypothetical protein n=1 Tax=Pseudarthrobacter scleromae TaxID=158897 RepID=UPI003639E338
MEPKDASVTSNADALRADLGREYEAIMKVISEYDNRLMTIKGWSVTLSLASLGLAFQTTHFALFGLGAASALAFWFIEALNKQYQTHYYSRMRDIEVAAFHLNNMELNGQKVSSPKVDWWWGFDGTEGDDVYLPDTPIRRSPRNIRHLLAAAPWRPNVFLPHAVAAVMGLTLFVLAILRVPGFEGMIP